MTTAAAAASRALVAFLLVPAAVADDGWCCFFFAACQGVRMCIWGAKILQAVSILLARQVRAFWELYPSSPR
jgi:hypothetical protein